MAAPEDRSEPRLWVACLCAQWCGVCREWQATFVQQARMQAEIGFAWIDVEDEDDAMGDIDIETFPTLLVARDGVPLFLGPVPPSGAGLARLVATLQAQTGPAAGIAAEAAPLLRRLERGVLRRSRV